MTRKEIEMRGGRLLKGNGAAPRRIFLLGAVIAALLMVSVASAQIMTESSVSPAAAHFPHNKQNGSSLAANPIDPGHVISGASDEIEEPNCGVTADGSSNCALDPKANTTGVYVTKDGGATWSQQILDWGEYGLVSDGSPAVAFGPRPGDDGFSYAEGARAYLGFLARSPDSGPNHEMLAVSFSDDGGTTWSRPAIATTQDTPVDLNDKLAIWADQNPASPYFGNLYVSWTLFTGNDNSGESNAYTPQPIMMARSSDAGLTFEQPHKLIPSHTNSSLGGRQGSTIRTDPNGDVYVFWDDTFGNESAIVAARSSDGGATFDGPFLVAHKSDLPSPLPGASFRTNSFPSADIDAQGNLYVAWADYTHGHGVVKIARSRDAGDNWHVSKAADVPGRSAFYPALAVAGSHVLIGFNAIDDVPVGTPPGAGVLYYDAYFAFSDDEGASFDEPAKISATASDSDAATTNSLTVQFLGDHNGAAAGSDSSFWFSWTDTRNGAPCPAVDAWRASGLTAAKPNIYDSCAANFGNSDIFVTHIMP
jgi:hypothetical protein